MRKMRQAGLYYLGEWICEYYVKVYPKSIPLKEELAIFYFYTGRYNDSQSLLNTIMDMRPDDDVLDRCIFNKRLVVEKVSPPPILPVVLAPFPLVTMSITTCRRLDLFMKTMDSFLANCLDHNLICKYICVDDNSSEGDRATMKKAYPFIDFIMKDDSEKGHAKSMQIIASKVKTPYLLHLEDDWVFFDKRDYISDMIEILEDDPQIGQVLFNENYAELPTQTIAGGHPTHTTKRLKYIIHEHCVTATAKRNFRVKYGAKQHCNYWPHYSLRPGLTATKIYKQLNYKDVVSFEYEFAQMYVSSGFKTAFLPGIHCKHIGRLTTEIASVDKLNAYDLLGVAQFKSPKTVEAYVINLDRRPDRYNHFVTTQQPRIPFTVARKAACDGYKLKPSSRLRSIFEHNDYKMRRGIVGCALSHLDLITSLVSRADVDYFLIFEDDVHLCENFAPRLKRVLCVTDADIIILAHTKSSTPDSREGLIKYSSSESLKYSIGGAMCYLISPRGAKILVDYIEKCSMTNAIDTMIQHICDLAVVEYLLPHVLISDHQAPMGTDIQGDYSEDLNVPGDVSQHRLYGPGDIFDFMRDIYG